MKIQDTGEWSGLDSGKYHGTDHRLADAISEYCLFENFTTVDLGCGMGEYVQILKSKGVSADGFDGNPDTESLTNGLCKTLNLAYDIALPKYDCVISLEVGEHIPKEYEATYLNNLCKTAKQYIITSWAIPGQVGDGHVNCQTNEYVVEEMKKRNFVYDRDMSEFFRKRCNFAWFPNTLMCFKNRTNND